MFSLPALLIAATTLVSAATAAPAPYEHIQIAPQAIAPVQGQLPAALHEPLQAVSRISTGIQANRVCNQLTPAQVEDVDQLLRSAVRTIYQRLKDSGIEGAKAQRILVALMDEGEKLGQTNFPTCTNLAPEIIVKATSDAACINQYLAGSNINCFR